jgi:hypothetical protein
MGETRIDNTQTPQPTEKANDQVGTHPQYIFRKSNDLPAEKLKAYVPQTFRLGPFHRPPHFQPHESENIKSKLLLPYYRDCHLEELVKNLISEGVTGRIREWYFQHQCRSGRMMALYRDEDLGRLMALYRDEDLGPMMALCGDKYLGKMMARDGLLLLQFLRFLRDLHQSRASSFAPLLNEILTSRVCNPDGCYRPLEQQFAVQEDVIKIDNQIPIFFLKKILQWEAGTYRSDEDNPIDQRRADTDQDLVSILKHAWFNLSPILYKYDNPDLHVIAGVPLKDDSHLLEFVYENIISSSNFKHPYRLGKNKRRVSCITLPPAVQLKGKGVKFAPNKGRLNEIRFDCRNLTLYLPTIEMDGKTDAVLRNLVLFEASKQGKESQPLRSYVNLMQRLIDTADDVQALRDGGIIHNHLGTNNEVANVWNGMPKQVPTNNIKYKPIDNAIYDVKSFYTSKCRTICTEIYRRYFSKPWSAMSFFAACILLGLAGFQTYLAWEQVRLQRESMPKT